MSDLEREIATYNARIAEMQAESGKFVLIKHDDLIGVFDTYGDALKAGYERFGLEPFLVRQIAPAANVLQFTRDISPHCPA